MAQDVLVVDDDDQVRKFIARGLSRVGYECVPTENGSSAIDMLRGRRFDAVICDLHMPEVDGLDVLRFAATLTPPPPFIMLTGYGSVATAVEAMKHGAADFLEKPASIEELKASIESVISRRSTPTRNASKSERPQGVVGSARWLEPFMVQLVRIARTDSIVLIEGETGTGKSAIARELWRNSSRAKGPFVELNCAAIPDALLENELFGHVRGAFTSSTGHQGKVEQANGGSLFLDEVGELKHELQAKLLHLLQERSYSPIGGTSRQADVRFIAATNRNLYDEVAGGRFRSDLYFRLNVVSLTIPSLRDRRDDVPVLLEHFRHSAEARVGVTAPRFGDGALACLVAYDWPGNVRELENLVERMSVMFPADTVIEPKHLPDRISACAGHAPSAPHLAVVNRPSAPISGSATPLPLPRNDSGLSLSDEMRRYERERIVAALRESKGNKSAAARTLNMKRTTLIEKCRKLEIKDEELKDGLSAETFSAGDDE